MTPKVGDHSEAINRDNPVKFNKREQGAVQTTIVSENKLHLHGTFFMFGGVLAALLPVSYIILPETKDISLGPVVRNPLASQYLHLHSNLI